MKEPHLNIRKMDKHTMTMQVHVHVTTEFKVRFFLAKILLYAVTRLLGYGIEFIDSEDDG